MEIRKLASFTMEASKNSQMTLNTMCQNPPSPCASEISVGCENEVNEKKEFQNSEKRILENDLENNLINRKLISNIPITLNGISPIMLPINILNSQSKSTSDVNSLQKELPHLTCTAIESSYCETSPKRGLKSPVNQMKTSPRFINPCHPRSPQSLSPNSTREDTESLSYFSEEEYFRPLKRLAMSRDSPNQPRVSGCISSPEGSNTVSNHPAVIRPIPSQLTTTSSPLHNPRHEIDVSEEDTSSGEESSNSPTIEERLRPEPNPAEDKLRSFSILDILSYKPSRRKSSIPVKIVRPWDSREDRSHSRSPCEDEPALKRSNTSDSNFSHSNNKIISGQNDKGSALDALFKMTNKTLDNLNRDDKAESQNSARKQENKKKRKSRTAFTNHQIFELEKRFLYQKYLSPADRDELAQGLGLSNAQVITWFQNRRAKLKRDMEELKRDVETTKSIKNKALLEASANVVAFLRAKDMPKIHLASLRRH